MGPSGRCGHRWGPRVGAGADGVLGVLQGPMGSSAAAGTVGVLGSQWGPIGSSSSSAHRWGPRAEDDVCMIL